MEQLTDKGLSGSTVRLTLKRLSFSLRTDHGHTCELEDQSLRRLYFFEHCDYDTLV